MSAARDTEKLLAAREAALLVERGMRVGLGTGTTVAFLLEALSTRAIDATFVATSPHTQAAALALGLHVEDFDAETELDLAIDGADQIAPDGWLIKGAGGALTREKIVAASAKRYVIIADSSKLVDSLGPPVPLELMAFGLRATLARLGSTTVRAVPLSPDGGVVADYHGEVHDPALLSRRLADMPGVVEHGLFAPTLISDVLVASGNTVRRVISGGRQ
jgi:ribose 5-phosphate isomerase A